MARNFNFSNGIIGKWKETNVYVVKEEELKDIIPGRLYAVSSGNCGSLMLVKDGKIIGEMTQAGDIKEYEVYRRYKKSEDRKERRVERKIYEKSLSVDEVLERAVNTAIYEEILFKG